MLEAGGKSLELAILAGEKVRLAREKVRLADADIPGVCKFHARWSRARLTAATSKLDWDEHHRFE